MKRALISDIHSNLEAFEAVLADIKQQGITEIYCLGDIIGYGPNPRECIDLVMHCDVCLLGNHDQGALFDPEGFNTGAERAIFWTRDQLESPQRQSGRQRQALGLSRRAAAQPPRERLPLRARLGPQPAQRIRLSRRHLQSAEDGKDLRPGRAPLLSGTHARAGRLHPEHELSQPRGSQLRVPADRRKDDDQRRLGRPAARRRSPRVATSCWKTAWSTFRRVEYDLEKTIQKIYDTPELDNFLGDRLREGR